MNYDKLIERLYKKACGKEIDKVSLKIYSNLLARGSSVEEVYEKMQSKLAESPISTIKYFFEKCHGVELTEKEKSFFLNEHMKNGLLKCLKNIKEYKCPENKKDDKLENPEALHTPQNNLNILYCSLIRDKEYFLEKWLGNIKSLKNLRPNWNIYLSCYENDSVDKTKEVLKRLDYSFLSWVKITSEDTGKKLYFNKERDRVKNLAAYRNLCINQYADLDKIDRIIMHDVDCVYDPEKAVHLIEESLKWDILSGLSNPSNNDKIIYDSWVTRKDKMHKKWDYNSFIKSGINEVYSTGNGFVCYNPEPFKKGIYFGYILGNDCDAENVTICENFSNAGYSKIAFDTRCNIKHFKNLKGKENSETHSVNVIKEEKKLLVRCQLGDNSSYDFHSRIILDGLIESDIKPYIFPYNAESFNKNLPPKYKKFISLKYNKSNLPELIIHPPKNLPNYFKRTIYSTMWETTKIPEEYIYNLNQCEAVVLPSKPNINTFSAQGVNCLMYDVPLGIDIHTFTEKNKVRAKNKIVFGTSGISRHGWPRKGFTEAVEAFLKAFPNGNENVEFRIKCYPNDPRPSYEDKRIICDEGEWQKEKLANWYRSLDCFVSMSKGEGFGLMPLEAMSCGTPCIIPNWFGPETYATEFNAFLVNYKLVPATNYYEGMGLWCEPNVKHCSEIMKGIYKNTEKILSKGQKASSDARKFTFEKMQSSYIKILNKHFFTQNDK